MKHRETSSYPQYRYPCGMAAGLVFDTLFQRQRSFRSDAQACIRLLEPKLKILGKENIPIKGPALITFNHYYRPGFQAWWLALAIAAVIPVEIHFGMTEELTYPGRWYAPLGKIGSRWLLRRLSRIYGLTSMPPMPPREEDVEARACSVRAMLRFAKEHPQAILALAPEGGDNVPSGALASPPEGVGRFVSLLADRGFSTVPAGVYEQDGYLCLRFGKAYQLELPNTLYRCEKDLYVTQVVMSAIAALIPTNLQGEYAPLPEEARP